MAKWKVGNLATFANEPNPLTHPVTQGLRVSARLVVRELLIYHELITDGPPLGCVVRQILNPS